MGNLSRNTANALWHQFCDSTMPLDTGIGGFAYGSDLTSITLTTTANKRDFLTAIYVSSASKWLVVGFIKGS